MATENSDVLNESLILIKAFKTHLSFINADYLSQHIIGVIRKGVVRYRDPDKNWYYKKFCADIDNVAKDLIGIDKQTGHYLVTSTDFRDYYLYDLINSLRIETEENYQKDIDETKIKELESQWKKEIILKYQRDEHIRRFVWDLPPFAYSHRYGHLRDELIEMVKEIIPNDVDFYSFIYCGLCYQCLDFSHPSCVLVSVKNAVGLFGNYVHYGRDEVILQDQKEIAIPSKAYIPGLKECIVVEISKGVFESLHEVEKIIIPSTIRKIEWSFWHCRKLKSIDVDKENKYYSSIDGVLYSKNHKILYAYPNMHSSIYEVPEGVEILEKFAFKDCENIEMLILPSTIKQIKINAFYRATELRRIVCECHQGSFVFEGFYGDYGNVMIDWFYKS